MPHKSLETFGALLSARSITHRDEPFKLKSGKESRLFVDLRQGHADPKLLRRTGRYILQATSEIDYDIVVSAGIDGRAVVSGILFASSEFPGRQDLEARWANDSLNEPPINDEPKNGRGFRRSDIEDKRVLVVDGTLTSGGSLETVVDMARDAGAVVEHGAVVVDRSTGRLDEIARHIGIQLHSLFELDEANGILVPKEQ